MFCTKCGHRNADEANFCARCGTALSTSDETTMALPVSVVETESEGPSLDELEPGQALLVIKGGPGAGETILLNADVTRAGRGTDSDVFLNDITVSRRHVEIIRDGTRFTVKDAGSLNGTYVNRERVDAAELSSGDELQIGKYKIVFYTSPHVDG